MRKLKLQVQTTVDGFIAGSNGEMDFLTWSWGDDIKQYIIEFTASVDCIVLGRKLAEGFIPHWAAVAADPEGPEYAIGKLFTDMQKVVFTKTLTEIPLANTNTVLATGDLVEEIAHLKSQTGGDMIAYGGATFVASLIKHGLIDEFHLFVNPAAIGNGLRIFNELEHTQALRLVRAVPFECGIVVLHYQL